MQDDISVDKSELDSYKNKNIDNKGSFGNNISMIESNSKNNSFISNGEYFVELLGKQDKKDKSNDKKTGIIKKNIREKINEINFLLNDFKFGSGNKIDSNNKNNKKIYKDKQYKIEQDRNKKKESGINTLLNKIKHNKNSLVRWNDIQDHKEYNKKTNDKKIYSITKKKQEDKKTSNYFDENIKKYCFNPKYNVNEKKQGNNLKEKEIIPEKVDNEKYVKKDDNKLQLGDIKKQTNVRMNNYIKKDFLTKTNANNHNILAIIQEETKKLKDVAIAQHKKRNNNIKTYLDFAKESRATPQRLEAINKNNKNNFMNENNKYLHMNNERMNNLFFDNDIQKLKQSIKNNLKCVPIAKLMANNCFKDKKSFIYNNKKQKHSFKKHNLFYGSNFNNVNEACVQARQMIDIPLDKHDLLNF